MSAGKIWSQSLQSFLSYSSTVRTLQFSPSSVSLSLLCLCLSSPLSLYTWGRSSIAKQRLERMLGRWWSCFCCYFSTAGSRAYRMAAHGSSVPASRWQARFPDEARGLHRNWLRTYTRSLDCGGARPPSVFSISPSPATRTKKKKETPDMSFFFSLNGGRRKGQKCFFSFENFGKLKLIFKKPQKRRPKSKFNAVTSQISKDLCMC